MNVYVCVCWRFREVTLLAGSAEDCVKGYLFSLALPFHLVNILLIFPFLCSLVFLILPWTWACVCPWPLAELTVDFGGAWG